MGFVNEKAEGKKWQTIDREKKITLIISKNNSPELGDKRFEIDLNGQKVVFCGTKRSKMITELKKLEITWEIFDIKTPPKLKKKSEEVKKVIEDAMEIFGSLHSTENVINTTVKFL